MTQVIRASLVTLLVSGLLAASGCKSSQPVGLVDASRSGAAGSVDPSPMPLASAREPAGQERENVEPARFDEADVDALPARDSAFSLSRTWKSATSWLPFGQSGPRTREARALDRELSLQPIPARGEQWRTAAETSARDARGTAESTPAAHRPASNGSLVRQTRRPPPDPAPKPPQEQLVAGLLASAPGQAKHTASGRIDRIIKSASLAWQLDVQRARLESLQAHNESPSSAAAQSEPVVTKDIPPAAPNLVQSDTPKSLATKAPAASGPIVPNETAANAQGSTADRTTTSGDVPENEGLRFRQPELAAARTRQPSGDAAQNAPELESTKPRRADLAPRALRVAARPRTATVSAATAWVAKKQLQTAPAGEPRPPADATSTQPDTKSIVADTFARALPTAAPPTTAGPSPVRDSAFPLPEAAAAPPKSVAMQPAAGEFVINPHVLAADETRRGAAADPAREMPVQIASSATPTRPLRPVGSPLSQPTAFVPGGMSGTAAKSRSDQPAGPMPPASHASSSYQAYYHRGVLAGAETLMPPQATSAPQIPGGEHSAEPQSTAAPQQLAPLVEASQYRQQHGARIPVTDPEPAPRGSWLAAYQKLVGRQPSAPSESSGAATRSIRSDQ